MMAASNHSGNACFSLVIDCQDLSAWDNVVVGQDFFFRIFKNSFNISSSDKSSEM